MPAPELVNRILDAMYATEQALRKIEEDVEVEASKLVALAEEYASKFQKVAEEIINDIRAKVSSTVDLEIKLIEKRYKEARKREEEAIKRTAEANMEKAVKAALEELLGAVVA
ncbi:MAG TPA: hypothetical protein EYP08_08430 [Pyrodictiaceae archaeon]|nr:hypothetical protein [Pyrodictiaceae archaeon]HIQ11073.1 hypothetical protein [Pyrodictium sp.]